MICRALEGLSKDEVILGDSSSFTGSPSIEALARGRFRGKSKEEIRGSGYVVESLEAALWSFDRRHSYEAAVLEAANLGDDAETTAAVTGQIAGAFYGRGGIPTRWLERLAMLPEIAALADRLQDARP